MYSNIHQAWDLPHYRPSEPTNSRSRGPLRRPRHVKCSAQGAIAPTIWSGASARPRSVPSRGTRGSSPSRSRYTRFDMPIHHTRLCGGRACVFQSRTRIIGRCPCRSDPRRAANIGASAVRSKHVGGPDPHEKGAPELSISQLWEVSPRIGVLRACLSGRGDFRQPFTGQRPAPSSPRENGRGLSRLDTSNLPARRLLARLAIARGRPLPWRA